MRGRVLLLNASFEPLQLITARRAVVLMMGDRVDVVARREDAPLVRSPNFEAAVPSVVRLRHYVKIPFRATQPPLSRRAVLARDHHRCAYCGNHADTIDHVVPKSRGGGHEWSNLVAACKRHNLQKGNRLLSELGWELRHEPAAPVGFLWRWRHLEQVDPLWTEFLGEPDLAA